MFTEWSTWIGAMQTSRPVPAVQIFNSSCVPKLGLQYEHLKPSLRAGTTMPSMTSENHATEANLLCLRPKTPKQDFTIRIGFAQNY